MKLAAADPEEAWATLLVALLERSPLVTDVLVEASVAGRAGSDPGFDGDVSFKVAGEPHRLIVECKSSGQPRYARDAIQTLGQAIFRAHELTRGLFVAPFISPSVRQLLAQNNIGWLDLAGNARLVFPRLHLEVEKRTAIRSRPSGSSDRFSSQSPRGSSRCCCTTPTLPGRWPNSRTRRKSAWAR